MDNSPLLSDVMVTDVVAFDYLDDLRTISRMFNRYSYDYIPVVKNGRLKGMIQRNDYENVVRQLSRQTRGRSSAALATIQAHTLMTNNIVKLATNNSVAEAIEIFEMGLFPTIPIVNPHNELVGILTSSDLLNHQTDCAAPTGSSRLVQKLKIKN